PVIYYGDEIGMGDNIYLGDRNGVRTPMQWSPDRNAGFSHTRQQQQLYLPAIIDSEYHFEAINVETQDSNASSLLWWMRRMISARRNFKAFSRGTMEFLFPDNSKVLAFVREFENEKILVLVNLSRFSESVHLDLSRWAGYVPVEVFSQNRFPRVKEEPYFFTFGPHSCYWFSMEHEAESRPEAEKFVPPLVEMEPAWDAVLATLRSPFFEKQILPAYVKSCRWFGGKAHVLRSVRLMETVTLGSKERDGGRLAFVQAIYADIRPELYLLPLQIASGAEARRIAEESPGLVIARFQNGGEEHVLFDALCDEAFRAALFDIIVAEKSVGTGLGSIAGTAGAPLKDEQAGDLAALTSRMLKSEQSNSAIIYGDKYFLKLYRKLEEGENPDAELIRFLSDGRKFESIPAFCGEIEYRSRGALSRVIGLLVALVPNVGNAWDTALDSLGRFFERALTQKSELDREDKDVVLEELLGGVYQDRVRLLALRTAEMHLALAADVVDPRFAPEPFTSHSQRSLYQSMRSSTKRMTQLLKKSLNNIPEEHRAEAAALIKLEGEILKRQARLLQVRLNATKIRVHGDYHLGQVLNTGKDFIITDFEGEPARPLSERKMKRSAMRDVAGILRSFDYAIHVALKQQPTLRPEDAELLQPWAEMWADWVGRLFMETYLETAKSASFIPLDPEALNVLLEVHLLEKATYEVCYELNNRPEWVFLPVRGIMRMLKSKT
ncbi:MAG: putative maltokinase, partial [Chthoniobacteraceae bacterium]